MYFQGTNWSSISGLPVVHNHGYVCELPKGHSFPMAKFNIIFDMLVGDGLVNPSKQVWHSICVLRSRCHLFVRLSLMPILRFWDVSVLALSHV